MERIDFNENWMYRHLSGEAVDKKGYSGQPGPSGRPVTLPHDAMLTENRSEKSASGINGCWFEGHDYLYEKEFHVPSDYRDKDAVFEFEGVYHNAEVLINGQQAAFRPYGYTNFYVDANPYLKYGGTNRIEVIARNADQPNSRWYSGAGIYRPVSLYLAEKRHILMNGVKVRTKSIRPAVVEVLVDTTDAGRLTIEILREGRVVTGGTADTAIVEVYARAARVDMFINGKKVGSRRVKAGRLVQFETKYYSGKITAVAYDENGDELSRNSLETAENETYLNAIPEQKTCAPKEICFVKLAPGFTSYRHQLQYQTYDITDSLRDTNELIAVVGGGWAVGAFTYKRRNRVYAKRQALLCELRIVHTDGSTEVIGTDETWNVTEDGRCRETEFYNGEVYDADVDYDQISWRNAALEEVRIHPEITAQYGVPVRAHEIFRPVSVTRAESGILIYDFGQNFAGVICARLKGRKGQRLRG